MSLTPRCRGEIRDSEQFPKLGGNCSPSPNFPYNGSMAKPDGAYARNLCGDFFVDDTCIDCDLCREIAAGVFEEADDHSSVYQRRHEAIEATSGTVGLD